MNERGVGPKQDRAEAQSRVSVFATVAAALALAVLFMGATIPTPLYPLYQKAFHFSGLVLTLVYAVYVLGNVVVLILFGGLADRIGRRRTIAAAVALALASAATFAVASDVAWLFAARFLSGLATALGAAAATAWITDAQGDQAASRTAAASNFAGLAFGAVFAGVLAQVAPSPLLMSYAVYLVILVGLAWAVVKAQDPSERRSISLASLWRRPRIGAPRQILRPFLSYAATGFAVFALVGFYAALIPNLLAQRLDEPSPVVAGAVAFELFAVAAASVLVFARLDNRVAARVSLALLVLGVALLIGADAARSMLLLVSATFVGGVGAALGYRGSLALVNAIAPDESRSEILSAYLIAVYCGNSLPVIGVGALSAVTRPTVAHGAFGVVISLLALFAFLVSRRVPDQETGSP